MKPKKPSTETQLNDYYRRRCVNYERFICDRVWECAFCARQSAKVKPIAESLPVVTHLRRR